MSRIAPTTCVCCQASGPVCDARLRPHWHCTHCGHEWREEGHERDYAGLAGRTIPHGAHLARRIRERVAFIGDLAANAVVLEVGCAEGELGGALRARHPGIRLVGVEPSADALAARVHFDQVHQAPLTAALLAGLSADVAVAFHVLEHLADPGEALRELRRCVRPGGRLVLEVPNGSGHALVPFDGNVEHLHFFTAASLACLLRRADFEVVRLESGGFESPLYPDCLRIEAQPVRGAADRAAAMRRCIRARVRPGMVIWGAGGDFTTYLRPFLTELAPAFIVDADPARLGERIDGVDVRAPEALLASRPAQIIIGSYRYEQQIADALAAIGIGGTQVLTLAELIRFPADESRSGG